MSSLQRAGTVLRQTRAPFLSALLSFSLLCNLQLAHSQAPPSNDAASLCPEPRMDCVSLQQKSISDWLQFRANQEVLNVTQAQLLAQSWGSNFLSCIGNTSFVPLRTYRLYIWRDRLPIAAILEQSSASFYNVTGILVAITMFANQADMIKEVIFQAEQGTRTFDMLLLDPVNFVTLASMGALQDLTALVTADNTLQWEDVQFLHRKINSNFGGEVLGMPFVPQVPVMLYRRDVVARLNVSLPHTYEELLEFATRVNGTPYWDAATNQTQRLWGLCSSSGFAEAFDLGDVFGSGVQYKGASQGMVYNPATMTPLANSSAMIRALSLWQRLIRYHRKSLSTPALLQGPCALTIELAFKAKLMALRTSPFAGNVGSLPLPGSEQVLDRATNTMQPCTPQLCPYAQAVAGPANSTRYINRAPYTGPLGYLLAARKGLSSQDLQAVYQFMAYTMAPSVQAQQNLQPSSFFVPMRSSQLDVSQVSTWEAAGYHPQDIEGLLATIRFQNDNGNVGSHLRLSTAHVLASLVNATVNLTAGQRPELVAQALQAAWAPDSQPGYTLDSLRTSYWRLINFAPSMPLKEVAWELEIEHMKEALGLGIGLGLGCMLLLVLGLLLVAKLRAAQHKSMLGKLLPPLAGPHTTLIVTDIQDSTKLWYESAYEGDSYTIAFHTAQSAVQFALAVQKALLTVDWPLQLLDQAELCRPFIVLPAAASSQLPAFHPAALAAGSSTFASMPLAMRLSLASRPEQPTVASYLRRLRPSQDMYFNRSTQSLELGPRNEPQQPSSATALPNQAAQHTLYASPTALHLLRSTAVVPSGTAGSLLLFRGLRVRMGMHTGVHDPSDVARDAGTGRQRYSGAILAAAKAVQDCAQGGQVLISEATFAELGSLALREDLVVMHAGQHVLKEGKAPEDIFNCFSRSLILRIAFLGPVRSVTETVSGCLAAPCEQATITFMNVDAGGDYWAPHRAPHWLATLLAPGWAQQPVGTATLMAWDARVCRKALRVYFDLGRSLLACSDTAGYLVEVTEGLLLVAALRPSCAIRWALSLMRSCLAADWPEELLAHELGEQVAMNIPVATQPANRKRGPQGSHQLAKLTRSIAESQSRSVGAIQTQLLVLMRGLRLKCGIDVGSVKSSVSSLSARMEFRGKVMNRAARISALATTGQVWVSDAVWQQAQPGIHLHKVLVEGGGTPSPTYQPHTPAPAPPAGLGYSWTARAAPEQIIAVDVGQHQLKGIQGLMSLKHVTFNDTGSSLVPAPTSTPPLTFTSRSVSNLRVPSF
ncbi:nucleotide cyclase [Haematococcus lacustris]